ncbi:hypothetical protein [Robiginitalea sp. SC105]|uniref:hypothetical protein n=1 Tax=Robiginitalea sp. SC105 TaxID=2762332 RepID=UPI00163A0702|nr:hypothetical protein [Robiginitalea sp. SC105]MBC2839511.1 hypothetical protein [Robiginitalea sp. SC105]
MKARKEIFLLAALAVSGFLLLVYLSGMLGTQWPGLGFLRELLTLPALGAQLVLLVLGIIRYRKFREREVLAGTLVLLLGNLLCLGSFFW